MPDAARASDDERFTLEALPWLDDVYRFALSMTRDEADADDVVQETFLRAYRSWRTFQLGTNCRRWLFTICRNVFLRHRSRERWTDPVEEAELDTLTAVREHGAIRAEGWDDYFLRLDLGPAIRRALDTLAEPFRVAVILVDVEGMSYDEAAAVLGVPVGTIRSRLFRGRRMMQHDLIEHARDAGLVHADGGGARDTDHPGPS
jgi:RNA polymerase sigma-70 factor (ECF subfamily)